MITSKEVILRLVLSAIIGGLIGMEREANNRPAGLRTHILVTIGSSLIMLISIDGFNNLSSTADPARLAAQVVSGIGFLGAGTILRQGNSVKGLTTAASLWVCAGIGLAIGGGYYLGALVTCIIVLFSLTNLGAFENNILNKSHKTLVIECIERPGLIGDIGQVLGELHVTIKDIKITRDFSTDDILDLSDSSDMHERIQVKLKIEVNKDLDVDKFIDKITNIENIEHISWQKEAY